MQVSNTPVRTVLSWVASRNATRGLSCKKPSKPDCVPPAPKDPRFVCEPPCPPAPLKLYDYGHCKNPPPSFLKTCPRCPKMPPPPCKKCPPPCKQDCPKPPKPPCAPC